MSDLYCPHNARGCYGGSIRKLRDDNEKIEELAQRQKRSLQFLRSFDPAPSSADFCGDVQLLGCHNTPVNAHRLILSSRYSIFKRMFESEMKEKRTGVINVAEFNSSNLRQMVNFCYTGEIVFSPSCLPEVMAKLAHKCDITELKLLAENELCKSLTLHNASERMVLASVFELERLKKEAVNFVCEDFGTRFPAVLECLTQWGGVRF